MKSPFQLTPQASEDLDAIWWTIAEHSQDAAGRVEIEIVASTYVFHSPLVTSDLAPNPKSRDHSRGREVG